MDLCWPEKTHEYKLRFVLQWHDYYVDHQGTEVLDSGPLPGLRLIDVWPHGAG